MKLRMGTRGSALALAQSGQIAQALKSRHSGLEVETVVIKTAGDRFALEAPAGAKLPEGGGKGLFVKEIEEALLNGKIDFAVHSAKDLPADIPEGLLMAAYPLREEPWDVFIARPGFSWKALGAGHRVATSSLRRRVQILAAKPEVEIVPMRGNVDTRLRKLESGACDGLILALAGLRRLGRAGIAHEILPSETILPAPGQGALALEARADKEDVIGVLRSLDHAPTRLEVEFERSFMRVMGGDCSTPLGALARATGTSVRLSVFWSAPDGSSPIRLSETCPDPSRREEFTESLADRIL